MAKAKTNKVTFDEIIKSDSQYDELKKITFENGKYTEIYAKFRPSKIDTLIEDFSDFSVELTNTGIEFNEKNSFNYLMLHTLQHFSTLVPEFPTNINEKMVIFDKMIDSEIVEKTIEAFDPNEIAKVVVRMYKRIERYQKMFETNKELKEQFLEKIKGNPNAELIEKLLFSGDSDANIQQSE